MKSSSNLYLYNNDNDERDDDHDDRDDDTYDDDNGDH
jgi:hypothetical protein